MTLPRQVEERQVGIKKKKEIDFWHKTFDMTPPVAVDVHLRHLPCSNFKFTGVLLNI